MGQGDLKSEWGTYLSKNTLNVKESDLIRGIAACWAPAESAACAQNRAGSETSNTAASQSVVSESRVVTAYFAFGRCKERIVIGLLMSMN